MVHPTCLTATCLTIESMLAALGSDTDRIQAATDAPLLSLFSRNPLLWGSRPLRVAARDGPHCGESAQWLMKVVPSAHRSDAFISFL